MKGRPNYKVKAADDSEGSKSMSKYKINGNRQMGYNLLTLGECGLWYPVSHHDSMELAEQAQTRAENRELMKGRK